MLLGEMRRWGVAREMVDELLPNAARAIEWIEEFGDADGDGYVEYQRATDRGLANQGWKDSWDGIRYADGTGRRGPDRAVRGAGLHLRRLPGPCPLRLRGRATPPPTTASGPRPPQLKAAFNRDFWLEDKGWFAVGLDADKRAHRLADLQHRSLPVDRDRRRGQGPTGGRGAGVPGHVHRMGAAHPVQGQRRLQPDQLPLRIGVAARHGHRGRRPGPLRVRRRGPEAHLRPARRRHRPGRSAARAVQRPRPGRADRAGRLPDVVLAAGLGGGVAAAVPAHPAAPRPLGPLRQDLALPQPARVDRLSQGGGHPPGRLPGDRRGGLRGAGGVAVTGLPPEIELVREPRRPSTAV